MDNQKDVKKNEKTNKGKVIAISIASVLIVISIVILVVTGGASKLMGNSLVSKGATIKYNSNNGIGTMPDQKVTPEKDVVLNTNTFTKEGYTFNGWVAQKSDGTLYCYTSPSKQKGSWVNKSECNFGYYIFADSSKINMTFPEGTVITMFAQWRNNNTMYTVKYNSNGGTGSMPEQKAGREEAVDLMPNKFTKAGYSFAGWVAQKDTGEKYCSDSPGNNYKWLKSGCYGNYVFKDTEKVKSLGESGTVITMYAQWKTQQFLIRFKANGGTGTMSDQKVIYGESTKLYGNAFKRNGYSFVGWTVKRDDGYSYCYTSPSKQNASWMPESECNFGHYIYKDKQSVSDTALPNRMVTMYAQWKKENVNSSTQFTVKFNSNGGTGTMSDQKMIYGSSNTLKLNSYIKKGYQFNGWVAQRWDGKVYCYTSSSKTKAEWMKQSSCKYYYYYKNGQKLSNTVPAGKVVTMFAQWKKK